MSKNLFISVVVPVRNGAEYISECIEAIQQSQYDSYEIIVVDDCSTDNTAKLCTDKGASVISLDVQSGPAAARNSGAKAAKGEVVLFIDADVVVTPETLGQISRVFNENPGVAAVFGSYDDEPAAPDFVSQYRNLLHHYVHQIANRDAKTFWTGCGAIRKDVIDELSGFDQARHPIPSMEDIEIGLRITARGYNMILDKDIQVKHLKNWGFFSLIKTDIFQRAVPWSKLILERKSLPRDLNLRFRDRVSTALLGISIILVFLYILGILGNSEILGSGYLLWTAIVFLGVILILNKDLYLFFYKKRGFWFALRSIPMHLLFYIYSGATFGVLWIGSKFK